VSVIRLYFAGGWQLLLGTREETIEAADMEDIRTYVRTRLDPIYHEKLDRRGIRKRQAIWDNSNILLNGRSINQTIRPVLKDGDQLVFMPRVAGG